MNWIPSPISRAVTYTFFLNDRIGHPVSESVGGLDLSGVFWDGIGTYGRNPNRQVGQIAGSKSGQPAWVRQREARAGRSRSRDREPGYQGRHGPRLEAQPRSLPAQATGDPILDKALADLESGKQLACQTAADQLAKMQPNEHRPVVAKSWPQKPIATKAKADKP